MARLGDREIRPRCRTRHDAGKEAQAQHGLAKVTDMKQAQVEPVRLPRADTQAPQGVELRHLRYFAAVADAGTFTRAADRLFIAQPTLSQQIGRLEQILGTPLLHRGRDGVRLTAAGTVLLDAARDVLSRVDHGVSQTRQAAGLGRPRLRFVMPADLPDSLAVQTVSRLRSAADAARVAITWLETTLDAEFSPIRQHRADAGLGWLTASPDALPAPLDAMSLGQFEPEVWIPCSHQAARRGVIGLDKLASMDVIHGPRRASTATYDRWLKILRAIDPRFEFTDPPVRRSLPMALAFAATASRPTAFLTSPAAIADTPPCVIRLPRPAGAGDMVRVSIADHPLTATAALVWNGDLPRPLQQILFDTADGLTRPAPVSLSHAG
jgi:DNA-binding transcriptional LysR family regulator